MAAPHIYLDVDDVLAETTRAMAGIARARFGKRVAFEDMTVFDLAHSLGLDTDEHARFMEAVHEEGFLLELAPMHGAADTTVAWHAAGAEISVVTGRPPDTRSVTARWLGRTGVPYHRLEVVDKYGRYGAHATDRARLLGLGYELVVEDSVEMAGLLVAETDAVVLLVDRPWNRAHALAHPRIHRVHDWRGIARESAALFPALFPPSPPPLDPDAS